MEFDAKTAIIIGFFVNRKKRKQTGSVFATHAHSASHMISRNVFKFAGLARKLATWRLVKMMTPLTGSEISLP